MAKLGVLEIVLMILIFGALSGWLASFLLKKLFEIPKLSWLVLGVLISALCTFLIFRAGNATNTGAMIGAPLFLTPIVMYLLAKLHLLPGAKARPKP